MSFSRVEKSDPNNITNQPKKNQRSSGKNSARGEL